jgi:hypothetical protein
MVCACLKSFSQTERLTSASNGYQSGDLIVKQQVGYQDAGAFGQGIIWDFSFLQSINDAYEVNYFYADFADTLLLCGREPSARFYYKQSGDTLYSIGFENNTSIMRYFIPEVKLKFPLSYGDTLYSAFAGLGQYGRRMPLNVAGYTRVKYDALGTLKVPDYPGGIPALRTHTQRYYTQASMDSLQMKIDTWSWYVQGTRYPVFESIQTNIISFKRLYNGDSIAQDTAIFQTSFYYPPSAQTSEYMQNANNQLDITNPINSVFTHANYLPNPVVDNLYINYNLVRNANVWFSLHSQGGVPLVQTTPENRQSGYNQDIISMSGFIQGSYSLYVHVDNMVLMQVIIKH